jgi:MOSC domain-containing protein YiiM
MRAMEVISLNLGRPRLVMSHGEPVSTAIFKEPVTGRVMMRTLNLDGDRQADLSVHGGPFKAVYAYPSEHYAFWKKEFPQMELPWGMFGENLTTEGLFENQTNIGNKFRIGGATVMAVQPRMPCYKLSIRFGRNDVLRRFLQSELSGIYFSVLEEGEVGVGDAIELVEKADQAVTITEFVRLYSSDKNNVELLRRAVASPALPESWTEHFKERLDGLVNSSN